MFLVAFIPYKFPLHLGNSGLIFCIVNWWAQPKKFLPGFHLLNLFTTMEGEGGLFLWEGGRNWKDYIILTLHLS